MKLPGALALALALMVAAPLAAASRSTTYWHGYTGAPVGAYCGGIQRPGDCPSLQSSSVQFGPLSASRAALEVRDDSGRTVGAAFTFYSAQGDDLGGGSFCDRDGGLDVPDGTSFVVVSVDNPLTTQHCGAASEGVSGYVMLRVS